MARSQSLHEAWLEPTHPTTQVLGWAATAPEKSREQIEKVMEQVWSAVNNGAPPGYAHAVVATSLEMANLIGRRSKAYIDYPTHLVRCRSPQQLLEQQARFMQDMMHDYRAANDRIVSTWLDAAVQVVDQGRTRKS